MGIIGKNELEKLINTRNKARDDFINQEKIIKEKYENNYYQLKQKARKLIYLWLYIVIGYLFVLLLLYKKLTQKPIFYSSIVVGVIIVLLVIYPLYFQYQKYRLKSLWNREEENLLSLKTKANELNEEVAKLSLAVICLSENIYELQEITNIHQLHTRWLKLLSQYRDGINLLHHNKATTEDYINFYRNWSQKG